MSRSARTRSPRRASRRSSGPRASSSPAATSAGAAMMSNSMFIKGSSETNPRFGSVDLGPGMDFIRGVLIDTHFSQRGRMGRLMTAVAHYPQDMGLGIDENTALLVDGDECEIV